MAYEWEDGSVNIALLKVSVGGRGVVREGYALSLTSNLKHSFSATLKYCLP